MNAREPLESVDGLNMTALHTLLHNASTIIADNPDLLRRLLLALPPAIPLKDFQVRFPNRDHKRYHEHTRTRHS